MKYSCALPFKTLLLDQSGLCGPWCNNSGAFNLSAVEIKNRWHSSDFANLRRKHLANIPAAECSRCYIEEKSGFKSQRVIANTELYPDFDINNFTAEKIEFPEKLIIRLSNICNFACQTCHSMDTSKYITDGSYYSNTYGDSKSRYVKKIETSELTENKMLQCFEIAINLKSIEFFGGEPMLNKTHFVLLKKLIESKQADQIDLFYSTNGSVYACEELINIWKHFKKIRIQFSIDGIEDQFHYMRWPGKWTSIELNITKYKNLSIKLGKPVHLGVNLTVSILNLMSIEKTTSWILNNFDTKHFITFAHDPSYYCIKNIPEHYKDQIQQHFEKSQHFELFKPTLEFMKSEIFDEKAWKQFQSWTVKKDQYRKLSYSKAFPEMAALLRNERFEITC